MGLLDSVFGPNFAFLIRFLPFRTRGLLPKSALAQGNRLVVRNIDASVNTTFICQATNQIGKTSTELAIFVRGENGKGVQGALG